MTWEEHAACKGMNTDLWFDTSPEMIDGAKAVCAECPVAFQCAQYAYEYAQDLGVWGGLTPSQRRDWAKKHKIRRKVKAPKPCGTDAAYSRHVRAGEVPCADCKRARSLAASAWRERAA